MKVEHIAYMVEKPVEVAAWYCRHLGFTVKRALGEEPWTQFIADERGFTVLIASSPMISPGIRKPVTCSRPSSVETQVLKNPVRMA